MNLHIVMHEPFEGPAALEIWAKQKHYSITYTRLYDGDVLPKNVDQFDFLILMGGPQSPATTTDECSYFDTKKEIALIKNAINSNKLVLGICLGAQLIGEALGAKFERSPNKEIGVFEVTLTEDAKHDAIFSTFPQQFLVAHWHNDMPGLTKESKVLATSAGCPRQIIRYTSRVYGFQCHFEFTHDAVENMLNNCGNDIKNKNASPFIQSANELRDQDYSSINQLLFQFLDQFQDIK